MGLRQRILEEQAVVLFPSLVGEAIAAHARAERVVRGTLYVVTDSPAWAQQLHLLRRSLVERVNRGLGAEVVREVRLRAGTLPPPPPPVQADPPPPVAASPVHPEAVEGALAAIGDEALRSAFRRAVQAQAERAGGPVPRAGGAEDGMENPGVS